MIQKTKIQFLKAVFFLGSTIACNAQIGIGTAEPHASASLEVASTSKGMLPPRMTQEQLDAITAPAAGLTVYNLTQHCLNFYDGAKWKSFCDGPPGTIASLDCASGTHEGFFKAHALSAGSKNISYAGGNGGTYQTSTSTSTGVTGLTATVTAGAFAGLGAIKPAISGIPSAVGTANFALSLGGQDCSFSIDVPSFMYGGTGGDYTQSIVNTADGGYIMAGRSTSSASGDVAGITKGGTDAWVVKMAPSGAVEWERLYGGSSTDFAVSIVQTPDGGYIVGGQSNSSASGDVTETNKGSSDMWILHLDASGNIIWNRLYGGTLAETFESLKLTADGGCIIVGRSSSPISGDITGPSTATGNMWILKLATDGTKMWDKLYGGNNSTAEYGTSIQQTTDGGYIVAGTAAANNGGNIPATGYGSTDVWVMKLDTSGNIIWNRLYGGNSGETSSHISQTSDGGYIFCAITTSPISGNITTASKGGNDAWIVKLDASGAITWQKRYGGSAGDQPWAMNQTADGGYIVSIGTSSPVSGDITINSYGLNDAWIIKLNALGNLEWQQRYGGNGNVNILSISQLPGGGYITAGLNASITGNMGQIVHGSNDAWVMELDALGNRIPFTEH